MRSKMIVLVVALLVGLAAFGLSACIDTACTRNTDCPSPLVCNMYGLCADKPVVMTSDGDGGSGDGGDAAGDGATTSSSAADAASASDGLLP